MQIRKTPAELAALAAPRPLAAPLEFLITLSGEDVRMHEVRAARSSADALIDALARHPHARGIAIRAIRGGRHE